MRAGCPGHATGMEVMLDEVEEWQKTLSFLWKEFIHPALVPGNRAGGHGVVHVSHNIHLILLTLPTGPNPTWK